VFLLALFVFFTASRGFLFDADVTDILQPQLLLEAPNWAMLATAPLSLIQLKHSEGGDDWVFPQG
jgi:hypothetical protein